MKALRIASPCEVPWSEMSPVEGGRHCATCDRDVLDVSRLTKTELLRVLQASQRPCVRQHVAPDGELILAAPPRPPRPVRPAAVVALAALVSAGPARAEAPADIEVVAESSGETPVIVQKSARTEIAFEHLDIATGVVQMGAIYGVSEQPLPAIDFDPGTTRLSASGLSVVSYIAAVVGQDLGVRQLVLQTHVAPGEKPKLAQRRLEATRDGLVSLGVPRDAITLHVSPTSDADATPGRVDITLCDATCENAPSSVR